MCVIQQNKTLTKNTTTIIIADSLLYVDFKLNKAMYIDTVHKLWAVLQCSKWDKRKCL